MKLLLASLLLMLSGCALWNRPAPELITSADYGNYPDNYKEIVGKFMQTSPTYQKNEPIYYNWRGPSKGYSYDGSGAYFGYIVCVEVKTRNELGGYTVGQPYMHIINNGDVIKVDGGNPLGSDEAQTVTTACSSF